MNDAITLLLALAVLSGAGPAEQRAAQPAPKEQTPKPGTLTGRVFAITEGGDLKPARMAKVYLFYHGRGAADKRSAKEEEQELNSAAGIWLKESNKAAEAYTEWLMRDGPNSSTKSRCLKELTGYIKAVGETLDQMDAEKKRQQFAKADADEEGNFNITVQRPGKYAIIALGRAGPAEAIWLDQDVRVQPGANTIKLSSPEKLCRTTD